jgi:hypothetical protein
MLRIALIAAVLAGCSGDGRHSPEQAVKRFIAVARSGDRAGVYRRLGPATRARIETLRSTTGRQSGRLTMNPEDFLSVGWAPPAWEPAGMRTLRRNEASAEVEVYAAGGDRQSVTLVREGEDWKIELPGR